MGELKRVLYGHLGGGFSDDLPYGSQRPTSESPLPPFRDMQNMIWSQGALRNAWEWTALDDTTYTNPSIDGNVASRQETTQTNAQYVIGGALISTSFTGQKAYVVITDGEIFVNGLPMNPTYAVTLGSVDTSGGYDRYPVTESIVARGIKVGDVVYDTTTKAVIGQMSPLTTNSIGILDSYATLAASSTVRRTFVRGVIPGKVSWDILNGDLYVACQGAGLDPAGTSGWCVLKVANIFGTPTEATYILSTWDVTGAMSTDSIVSGIDEIMGLKATADGRIILATNEDGLGNRIRWCSHRDVTKWANNEEAGFTDLAKAKADIKCLSRIGEQMVVYFADQIWVGLPTHQQHLPYTWQQAPASRMGTRWYRGACESKHGNLVAGSDGHLYIFDGNEMHQLTDGSIRKYTKGPDQIYLTGETAVGETLTVTFTIIAGTITVA